MLGPPLVLLLVTDNNSSSTCRVVMPGRRQQQQQQVGSCSSRLQQAGQVRWERGQAAAAGCRVFWQRSCKSTKHCRICLMSVTLTLYLTVMTVTTQLPGSKEAAATKT
jgi:hypothetical protein